MSKCINCECEAHESSKYPDNFYQDHGVCEYCYFVGCDSDEDGECKCD